MTSFEFRAWIVLHVAKWLRVKMKDLHDSYPYNPYSHAETMEAWSDAIKKTNER